MRRREPGRGGGRWRSDRARHATADALGPRPIHAARTRDSSDTGERSAVVNIVADQVRLAVRAGAPPAPVAGHVHLDQVEDARRVLRRQRRCRRRKPRSCRHGLMAGVGRPIAPVLAHPRSIFGSLLSLFCRPDQAVFPLSDLHLALLCRPTVHPPPPAEQLPPSMQPPSRILSTSPPPNQSSARQTSLTLPGQPPGAPAVLQQPRSKLQSGAQPLIAVRLPPVPPSPKLLPSSEADGSSQALRLHHVSPLPMQPQPFPQQPCALVRSRQLQAQPAPPSPPSPLAGGLPPVAIAAVTVAVLLWGCLCCFAIFLIVDFTRKPRRRAQTSRLSPIAETDGAPRVARTPSALSCPFFFRQSGLAVHSCGERDNRREGAGSRGGAGGGSSHSGGTRSVGGNTSSGRVSSDCNCASGCADGACSSDSRVTETRADVIPPAAWHALLGARTLTPDSPHASSPPNPPNSPHTPHTPITPHMPHTPPPPRDGWQQWLSGMLQLGATPQWLGGRQRLGSKLWLGGAQERGGAASGGKSGGAEATTEAAGGGGRSGDKTPALDADSCEQSEGSSEDLFGSIDRAVLPNGISDRFTPPRGTSDRGSPPPGARRATPPLCIPDSARSLGSTASTCGWGYNDSYNCSYIFDDDPESAQPILGMGGALRRGTGGGPPRFSRASSVSSAASWEASYDAPPLAPAEPPPASRGFRPSLLFTPAKVQTLAATHPPGAQRPQSGGTLKAGAVVVELAGSSKDAKPPKPPPAAAAARKSKGGGVAPASATAATAPVPEGGGRTDPSHGDIANGSRASSSQQRAVNGLAVNVPAMSPFRLKLPEAPLSPIHSERTVGSEPSRGLVWGTAGGRGMQGVKPLSPRPMLAARGARL